MATKLTHSAFLRTNPLGRVGIAVTSYVAVFGAALWLGLGASAGDAPVCFGPTAIAAALGATSRADRQQYVARLFAAALFLSIGLLMWGSSHQAAGWWLAWLLLAALAAFFVLLLWLARFTTRIAPIGIAPVGRERLERRLRSLETAGAALTVDQGADTTLRVDAHARGDAARVHRVTLAVDERRREVGVWELLGAAGAKPANAAERSMRAVGEAHVDPTRPDAQAVWARTWQSTMIVPEKLAGMTVAFDSDRVQFDPTLLGREPDGLVMLLAAVVTRSGYAWQPSLLRPRAARSESGAGAPGRAGQAIDSGQRR